MNHEGISRNRLPENPNEQSFAEMWDSEAPRILVYLIGDDYSQRDATVAATIVQWLGSLVGNSLVREVHASIEARQRREP